jgi:phospholipid transport system substrate-binding protein
MLAAAPVAASPDPLPTVQRVVASVIALVRSPEPTVGRSADRTMTGPERRAEIQRIAEQLFDFDEVGRRALWRHWAERTPQERAEFVQLFKALLARTYIRKIEMYSGETITFVGERIDGTAATVMSRIVNGKTREATALDYRLHVKAGRWLVYDVVIDGVSFVSNYRSQFDRMIRESGYPAMVQQLRLNVDQESGAVSASPQTGAGQRLHTPSR